MKRILSGLALAVGCASSVHAVGMIRTYDFKAYNIVSFPSGQEPPVDPVTGSITVSFNSSFDDLEDKFLAHLNSLNIGTSPLSFSYFSVSDELIFGGSNAGNNGMMLGTEDFVLIIHNATHKSTGGYSGELHYSALGTYYEYDARSVDIWDHAASGVPEPASWALMTGGFGLVGGAIRTRHRIAASFA